MPLATRVPVPLVHPAPSAGPFLAFVLPTRLISLASDSKSVFLPLRPAARTDAESNRIPR